MKPKLQAIFLYVFYFKEELDGVKNGASVFLFVCLFFVFCFVLFCFVLFLFFFFCLFVCFLGMCTTTTKLQFNNAFRKNKKSKSKGINRNQNKPNRLKEKHTHTHTHKTLYNSIIRCTWYNIAKNRRIYRGKIYCNNIKYSVRPR